MSYSHQPRAPPRPPNPDASERSYSRASNNQTTYIYRTPNDDTHWSREHPTRHASIASTHAPTTYSYAPQHAPSPTYYHTRAPQTPLRPTRRTSWPPSPTVEPEAVALRKELNPPRPTDEHAVPLRGTRSQSPVIQGPMVWDVASKSIVDASDPKYQGKFQTNPAVTRPAKPSPSSSSTKVFHSTDNAVKSSTARQLPGHKKARDSVLDAVSSAPEMDREQKRAAFVRECIQSDALRGDGKVRRQANSSDAPRHLSDSAIIVDDGLPDDPLVPSRHAAPYHMNSRDLQEKLVRPAIVEATSRLAFDSNQSPDGGSTRSQSPQPYQRTQKPPPLKPFLNQVGNSGANRSPIVTPTAKPAVASEYFAHSSGSNSRPQSPSHNRAPSSPLPVRASRDGSSNLSAPPSRETSRTPSPNRFDRPERAPTFPLDDRSSRRSSRLITSLVPSDFDSKSPSQARSSLPYPVDDEHHESLMAMPSEDDHNFVGGRIFDAPFISQAILNRESPSHSAMSSRQSSITVEPPSRPKLEKRHTADFVVPVTAGTALSGALKYEGSDSGHSGSSASVTRPSVCPRPRSTRDFDDWYTIEGCPNFDICPHCLEHNFAGSALRKFFKRQKKKDSHEKTKCDFASPWMRHAFVLTQEQGRRNLNLLADISTANAEESSCTGDRHDERKWYTVVDHNKERVDSLLICSRDMRKIEALFPSLRDCFVKSHLSGLRGKCSLRSSSPDFFSEAIVLLTDINREALIRKRQPNMRPFIDFVKPKVAGEKCTRDTMHGKGSWHMISHLPEFTVCDECYAKVVWPAIASGSSVANMFSQTPVTIYHDKYIDPRGASCQLWTPRMRKVFRRAVEKDDFKLLRDAAKDRKDAEMALQDKVEVILKKRLSRAEEEKALDDIRHEWEQWA